MFSPVQSTEQSNKLSVSRHDRTDRQSSISRPNEYVEEIMLLRIL